MTYSAAAKSVLVIFESSRLLPATIEADRGFSDIVASNAAPLSINAEFLGFPEFGGDEYTQVTVSYLQGKYRLHKPDVVVIAGSAALGFWLSHRADLFPTTPIVHMAVGKENLDKLAPPVDVYGVPVKYDPLATIDLALRLHPQTHKVVVVAGNSEFDRTWKSIVVQNQKIEGREWSLQFISGLRTDEMLDRVRAVDRDSVIYTPGYFIDGAGRKFAPRDVAKLIADAAPVPVYGPFDTFIGTGVVGGRVPTFREMGETAGRIALQLLNGASPADLQLPASMPLRTTVDWRQIERWAIDPRLVPADAVVHYKVAGLWDQYRSLVLAASGVMALQSLLVAGLVLERRRRHRVEVVVDRHRFELAHASRLAVAGQLTASIAHEINQPLGAIHSNIAALSLIIKPEGMHDDVALILEDIRRDNIRASEVVRQLRGLLEKHEVDRRPVDLKMIVNDTQAILRREALWRRVNVIVNFPRNTGIRLLSLGDRIQLQQVLINLTLNAMDAVAGNPDGERNVTLSVERKNEIARIVVSDNGGGIPMEKLGRLFEPFTSTKPNGMGLGLSIVRTLVEAHSGRVWGSNLASGGASFSVELPTIADVKQEEVG